MDGPLRQRGRCGTARWAAAATSAPRRRCGLGRGCRWRGATRGSTAATAGDPCAPPARPPPSTLDDADIAGAAPSMPAPFMMSSAVPFLSFNGAAPVQRFVGERLYALDLASRQCFLVALPPLPEPAASPLAAAPRPMRQATAPPQHALAEVGPLQAADGADARRELKLTSDSAAGAVAPAASAPAL